MKFYRIIIAILLLASSNVILAQVAVPNNVPLPANYVGFDGTSAIPLPIANIGDPRINIRSNGFNKIVINELPTWNGINGATANNASRITLGLNGQVDTAWSILHLWSPSPNPLSPGMHRDWFNVGTSYTGNQDFMYSGLLERPNTGGESLATDAVIAWGCQPGQLQNGNTDNFRFIFLRIVDDTPSVSSQTQQGQEMMRISPQGNVGIGDFSSNGFGIAEQPTHPLDVLGTARLRIMPTDENPDVIITGIQRDTVGDYELNYIPFADLGGNDCRWVDQNSATVPGQVDMFTGVAPIEGCMRGKVGIGTTGLEKAKLDVRTTDNLDNVLIGIYSEMIGTDALSSVQFIGIVGDANTDGLFSLASNVGVQGLASDSRFNIGVLGKATGYPNFPITQTNIGVRGEGEDPFTNRSIGVYGESNAPGGNSGYFAGGTFVMTGAPIVVSDEIVKENVEDLTNASEILAQLNPKTYNYVSPESRDIAFPDHLQYGFLAQDVEEILPDIVHETHMPEKMDSTGYIDGTAIDLLGIQYESIIPILVAGFNEQSGVIGDQQGLIQEQTDLIETMEETIAEQAAQMEALQTQMQDVLAQLQNMEIATSDCCSQKSGTSTETPRGDDGSQEMKLGQNVPNPFTNQTRIDFELPFDAQVILEITDGTGRPIQTLIDGQMSTGVHSTIWDGSDVAPGMYYYTLYANGELLSKKMIKR